MVMTFIMAGVSVGAYDTLQVGSDGDEVVRLQQALIDQGYLSGEADGDFGNMTADAVRDFQADYSLEISGVADEQTLLALYGETVEDDVFSGDWYFTSYEYLKYISTPDM